MTRKKFYRVSCFVTEQEYKKLYKEAAKIQCTLHKIIHSALDSLYHLQDNDNEDNKEREPI